MTEIETDKGLLEALQERSSRYPSPEQTDQQRLSFVMGVLPEGNDMTREEVQDAIERHEGRRLAL